MFEVAQDRAGGEETASAGAGDQVGGSVLDGRVSGVARAVATGRTVHVPDAPGSELLSPEHVERFSAASTLFVPVIHDGEVRRVVIVIERERREFTDAEIEHAEALAVGADLAGVYLGNGRDGGVATAGHGVPPEWHGLTLAPGEGAAGRALQTGATYVTNDYRRDVASPAHPLLGRVRTACAVPMAWNDELKGALSVAWLSMRRIEDDERRALEAIADLATVACHNAETYQQVQQAARTDALTGLLNHGAMQVRVREEIARARRDGTPLSFVIIDLDDFKRVNDVRGHQAGDELLRRVAALLQAELRPYDQVARYGGDEFVLLLPGSDEATARAVAERVRDAVAGELIGACSLGVAQWHEPLDADALLEHADRALLLA